jgi:putative flippase GtrA
MNILLPSQPLLKNRARLHEIALFIGVGLLNTAIDFTVLNLLMLSTHHEQGWWLLAFNGLSFLAAATNSYLLNGRFTFRHSSSTPGDRWRFIRFIAVNAGGLLINSVTVWTMAPLASHTPNPLIALNGCKALATILSLCWNYFAIKRWIFRTAIPEITHADAEVIDTVNVTVGSNTHNEF